MRRTAVDLLTGLGVFLLTAGLALGQTPVVRPPKMETPPPAKPVAEEPLLKLPELLDQALRDHPDIRVAEAHLRTAEAELNRVRLQVIQNIVLARQNIDALKAAAEESKKRYEVQKHVYQQGGTSVEEVHLVELQWMRYAAELAKAQAELPFLLGKARGRVEGISFTNKTATLSLTLIDEQPQFKTTIRSIIPPLSPSEGPLVEKIRKALDKSSKVDLEDVAFTEALDYLQHLMGGVTLLNHAPQEMRKKNVSLHLSEPVPVGAIFQALEDTIGVQFGVRDYGILVTDKLPPGVMSVHDFWRKPDTAKANLSSPPPVKKP